MNVSANLKKTLTKKKREICLGLRLGRKMRKLKFLLKAVLTARLDLLAFKLIIT